MKLAIMQPYFFPYISYWQLINAVDCFVILDDVNYIKRGWINRNRIICDEREHYIIKPVSNASQNRLICETHFVDDTHLADDLLRTICYAYRNAKYANQTNALLTEMMLDSETRVAKYLERQICKICSLLNIDTKIILASDFRTINHENGQSGILEICRYLDGNEYINPIGGINLYDKALFQNNNIELKFLKTDFAKIQKRIPLLYPDYSIIHLLMNCSLEEIQWMLGVFTLI